MRKGNARASAGRRAQAWCGSPVCPFLLSNLTSAFNAQPGTLCQPKLAEMK